MGCLVALAALTPSRWLKGTTMMRTRKGRPLVGDAGAADRDSSDYFFLKIVTFVCLRDLKWICLLMALRISRPSRA